MKQNLGTTERVITGVAAAGLAAFALKSGPMGRRLGAALTGGALAARAVTGHCGVKSAVEDVSSSAPIRVERQTVVNAPIESVYEFWNSVENFPKFMSHIQSVVRVSDRNSHWVASGPLGTSYEWDAEVTRNVPNDVIGWESTSGDVVHRGTVRFKRVGPKTRVKVRLEYEPPAGKVGATVAKLFGGDPRAQLDEYLKKLKKLLDKNPTPEQIRRGALPQLEAQ
jgi:uncharacterized membrane protein